MSVCCLFHMDSLEKIIDHLILFSLLSAFYVLAVSHAFAASKFPYIGMAFASLADYFLHEEVCRDSETAPFVEYLISMSTPDCTQEPCQIGGKKSIKFFFFADWGGKAEPPYYTGMEMKLAEGLAIVDKRERCDFFVTAGDNIYPRGVKNSSDPRFQETFVKVFKALARNKPWYIVAGNHDYLGSIDAQIGYHSINPTWIYPSRYYSFSYQSPDSFTVDFIMLDTIILCGNTLDSKDLISPPGPPNKSAADDQTRWLKERLESSRAAYIFIIGHYPVRSKGRNGAHVQCMRKIVEPLMLQYNTTAYMNGHDHNLQHVTSNVQNHKLNFIVSGTAAYRDSVQLTTHEENTTSQFFYPVKSTNNSPYLRRTSDDKPGFVVGKLTKYRAVFRFYNSDGTLLYNFNAIPRKSQFWSVLLKT